jgi:DNA gyrase subunit A
MDAFRDIPDVRDGLRPVHRKLLLVMNDAGLLPDGPYRRSATIVGEVRQRFPSQGARSTYNALVGMVRDFELRYPLLEGQGNFGSIEGDPVADSLYTEARLANAGAAMLADGQNPVGSGDGEAEPSVLPSTFPNLLANGAWSGKTIVPPHNLREVASAVMHLIDYPNASSADIRAHISGPDFPTGACIEDAGSIREYQDTGRGRIAVRARVEIETTSGATRIIVTEIPYRIDAAAMLMNIADAVRDGSVDGISGLRNEFGRNGLRIVIEPKAGVDPHGLLEQLYARTLMESTLTIELVALVPDSRTGALSPRTMPLKELLEHYIAHRVRAIAHRTSSNADASRADHMQLLKAEITRVAAMFGDERRTKITGA